MKLLVEHGGAKIDICDGYGQTALHRASSKSNLNIVKYLLQNSHTHSQSETGKGSSGMAVKDFVNIRDVAGNTALHCACEENCAELARYLIEEGSASITFENKDKLKPLDLCAKTVRRYLENHLL